MVSAVCTVTPHMICSTITMTGLYASYIAPFILTLSHQRHYPCVVVYDITTKIPSWSISANIPVHIHVLILFG